MQHNQVPQTSEKHWLQPKLRDEFAHWITSCYPAVFDFVTTNHGTVNDARECYQRVWLRLYLMQQLDLVPAKIPLAVFVQSLARYTWREEMVKRLIDLNQTRYSFEFVDFPEEFERLRQYEKLASRTTEELGRLGDTCRKLVVFLLGDGKSPEEVGLPLGLKDGAATVAKLGKCLDTLTENLATDSDLLQALNNLDLHGYTSSAHPDVATKHAGNALSRFIYLISQQQALFAALQAIDLSEPRTGKSQKAPKPLRAASPKRNTMRLSHTFALLGICAFISAITGFVTVKAVEEPRQQNPAEQLAETDTSAIQQVDEVEVVLSPAEPDRTMAFPIANNGVFLTSLSSVADARSVYLQCDGLEKLPCKVVARNEKLGLALLQSDESVRPLPMLPYKMAPQRVNLGLDVEALGLYAEQGFSLSRGYISNASDSTDFYSVAWLHPQRTAGSPLFSANGNIIACQVDHHSDKQASSAAILQWLQEYQQTENAISFRVHNANLLAGRNAEQRAQVLKPFLFEVIAYH